MGKSISMNTTAAAASGKIETKTGNHHNDEAFCTYCVYCCAAMSICPCQYPTMDREPATNFNVIAFEQPRFFSTMVNIAFLFAFLCNFQHLHFSMLHHTGFLRSRFALALSLSPSFSSIHDCGCSCVYSETFSLQKGTNQFIFLFVSSRYSVSFHSHEMRQNETHVCHLQILQRMLDLAASLNTNKNGMKTRKAFRFALCVFFTFSALFFNFLLRLYLYSCSYKNIFVQYFLLFRFFPYFCPSSIHWSRLYILFICFDSFIHSNIFPVHSNSFYLNVHEE